MGKFINFKDLILFEDEDIIVINKPPLISSDFDRSENAAISIIGLAKSYYADIQICHRIDKEASGILILAKNPQTYRSISLQFQNRKIYKLYHAICEGQHDFNEVKIDVPLGKTGKQNRAKADILNGKPSFTIVLTLQKFRHFTLVAAMPITGRFHQIRFHLSICNAPLAGDVLYGGSYPYLSKIKKGYSPRSEREEQPIMKRAALHAQKIRFETLNGKEMEFEAPYPKDFAVFLKLLEKWDGG